MDAPDPARRWLFRGRVQVHGRVNPQRAVLELHHAHLAADVDCIPRERAFRRPNHAVHEGREHLARGVGPRLVVRARADGESRWTMRRRIPRETRDGCLLPLGVTAARQRAGTRRAERARPSERRHRHHRACARAKAGTARRVSWCGRIGNSDVLISSKLSRPASMTTQRGARARGGEGCSRCRRQSTVCRFRGTERH